MTPEVLRLEVELCKFGNEPNPADLVAYCRECSDELTEPVEFREGVCLPCALGSVPLSAGVEHERDTSGEADRDCDGEYVIVDTGSVCARCEMPVAENDPHCFWCSLGYPEASHA